MDNLEVDFNIDAEKKGRQVKGYFDQAENRQVICSTAGGETEMVEYTEPVKAVYFMASERYLIKIGSSIVSSTFPEGALTNNVAVTERFTRLFKFPVKRLGFITFGGASVANVGTMGLR